MARDLFSVDKGYRIDEVNGSTLVEILSATAAPTGTGDQASAPIGSLYIRSGTGELYQKIANAGSPADWELNTNNNFSYESVPSSKILTIPENNQMAIFDGFELEGELRLDGSIVVED